MPFFDTLRKVLRGDRGPVLPRDHTPAPRGLSAAWGLDEDGADAGPTPHEDLTAEAGAYDREQWHKKLQRVLERLPASQAEWPDLMTEARALKLGDDWVARLQAEEFRMLIRRAVSDRQFTEEEHRTLDLARDLIGMPEDQAEAALHDVVAEAEAFFGGPVEGAS